MKINLKNQNTINILSWGLLVIAMPFLKNGAYESKYIVRGIGFVLLAVALILALSSIFIKNKVKKE